MAILLCKVPHDIARIMAGIDIPEEADPEPEGEFHITLIYFDNLDPADIFKVGEAIYDVSRKTGPFSLSTERVLSFPPSPEGKHPIIAAIDSPEIHKFRAAVAASLDAKSLPYSKKWPEFKPHVTLGYSPVALEEKKVRSLSWGCGEVSLWAGEWGDHDLSMTFPFVCDPDRKEFEDSAAAAAAVRVLARRYMKSL